MVTRRVPEQCLPIWQVIVLDLTFSYDEGLLAQILYPNSGRLNFRYNRLNRLTNILFNAYDRYTFEYDPLDNRTRMTDVGYSQSTAYAYTTGNRLQLVTEYSNNRTDYTYDAVGNVAGVTATVGGTGYAANFTYDRLYQLTRATFSVGSARYTYDENGNLPAALPKTASPPPMPRTTPKWQLCY